MSLLALKNSIHGSEQDVAKVVKDKYLSLSTSMNFSMIALATSTSAVS
jgi:hypothetical protein